MKTTTAICTSLILISASPFALAQGAAPPAGVPAIPGLAAAPPPVGAGGPPTADAPPAPLPGAIGIAPPPVPVMPRNNFLTPAPPAAGANNIAPYAPVPAGIPGAAAPAANGAPGAANPGTAAIGGFPGGGTSSAAPSAVPLPQPGQPARHNKNGNYNGNYYYESAPGTATAMTVAPASAPVPQTGQEIIRQAKLRVLQRHYEDTLNQMIQLEKDALAAPPEEREKMEASAKAMREFLNKLESELLPLADGPKRVFTTPAIPDRSQRPVGSEILDPPKPAPAPIRAGSSDAAPTAEKPERLSHSPSTTPPATPGPQQSAPPSAIPLGADATKNDVEKYRAVFRRVFERELDRALTQKSPGSAATPPAVRDSAPLRIAPPALTAPKIDHFPIAPPKIEPLRELPPAKLESPKPLATSQASPAPVTSHPSAARPASDLAKMAYEEYLGAARERVDRAWQLYQAGGSSPEEFAAAQRDLAAARADSTKAAEARLAEVKQAYDAVFNKRWDAHVASSATPLMNPELEAAARRVVQATAELDAAKAGLTAPNVDVARPSDGQTKQLEGNTGNVTQEGIRGRVLAVNSRWDFTVISIGSKQGAAAKKTLVVSRNGQAIGKIRISSVEENQSIANIIPDSFIRGPRIQPGDDVVFIGDEKVEAETNRGTGAATGKVGM